MAAAILPAVLSTAATLGAEMVFGNLVLSQITMSMVAQTFVKSFVINALLGAGGGNKSQGGTPDLTREARDRKQSIRNSIQARRVIYGTARVSGVLVYVGTTGSSKEYLWMVVPWAHGESESVEETWLNDLLITDTRYSGLASVTHHLGTSGQTVDTGLNTAAAADWTSDHRLRSIGYSVLKLTYSASAYPNGIPNPTFIVKGRKVYDPRDESTAWSNNPALCILDYLIGTVPTSTGTLPIGVGASLDEIDLDSFIAAANTCDEEVDLDAGGTQARYTCDGVVQLDSSPAAIIEQMLTSCAGTLVYSAGTYRLFVGAARAKSFTLTADMLRAPLKYRPRPSRRTLFNTMRGTYIDPNAYYEAADIPVQTVAAYVTEDGGEPVAQDVQLNYTQDGIRAQRIAMQMLKRQRLGLATIEAPCNWSALDIAVMDTGSVVNDLLGLTTAEKWRVTGWSLAEGGGVDLVLTQEDDNAYTWTTADEQPIADSPRPDMARADEVPDITGLTVDSASYTTPEGSTIGALSIDWDNAASAFVTGYDIEAREHGTSPWTISTSATVSSCVLIGLTIGTAYDVRVRARRANGATGDWNTESTGTTVSGDTSAPAAPTGVSATAGTGSITIDWTNPADSDFRKARLYRHTSNDSSAASVVDDIYGLPGQPGTYTDTVTTGATRYYWLKALDYSGNASAFSSGVSATAL